MSYMGVDPGDLTPEQMWGREDLEPLDRASCSECGGEGETIVNLLTGGFRVVGCKACLRTGTQRTRDELVDAYDPSEDDLTILNGPQ
jgi:hypothetical protein